MPYNVSQMEEVMTFVFAYCDVCQTGKGQKQPRLISDVLRADTIAILKLNLAYLKYAVIFLLEF